MWVPRNIEPRIANAVRTRPAVLLTGARQTGKTSLLRNMYPATSYVTLDLPSEAEAAERSPDDFFRRHGSPLLIDEVQYAPSLFRHLKIEIDRERQHLGRFLLTGSEKFALMRNVSESLAGRVAVLELDTLSLTEIHRVHDGIPTATSLLRGGFPELYRDLEIDAHEYYRSYVTTYLERDLRSMLRVSSLRDFERFLRVCATRSSKLLNRTEISREVGVSAPTVTEWINALEASSLVELVEPVFRNLTKSTTKSPKLFFRDTGLLAYLLGVSDEQALSASPYLGSLWESFVFAEFRKLTAQNPALGRLGFLRDRAADVDFALDRGGQLELYEVKWAQHPAERDVHGLRQAEAILGKDRVHRKVIVCRTPASYPLGDVHVCGLLEALTLISSPRSR